jgi:hypothetical protein
MTALHNTLESIYNTHLPNPTIIIPPPHLFDTYSPHSAGTPALQLEHPLGIYEFAAGRTRDQCPGFKRYK